MPSMARRVMADQTRNGVVEVGQMGEERQAATEELPDLVVCASGNLAQVYFGLAEERLTREQIDDAYPGLIDDLVAHDGVGLVLVKTETDGSVVLGANGITASPMAASPARIRSRATDRWASSTSAGSTRSRTSATWRSSAAWTREPTRSPRSRSSSARTAGSADGRLGRPSSTRLSGPIRRVRSSVRRPSTGSSRPGSPAQGGPSEQELARARIRFFARRNRRSPALPAFETTTSGSIMTVRN